MSKPSSTARVIATLQRIAADPNAWDQLVQDLDPAGAGDMTALERESLAQSRDIAQSFQRPGEGPSPTVDAAGPGCVILAANGRVLACNPTATATLADGLGRAAVGEPLRLSTPANTKAVAQGLERARAGLGDAIVRLERAGGEAPCFAYVTLSAAMIETGFPDRRDEIGLAALVFPPDAAARVWAALRLSFGLTEAEVRLARRLRHGDSLSGAAKDLGVSVHTVRNQLRAIFDKMGLQRQSELMRTLTELGSMAQSMDVDAPAPSTIGVLAQAPPIRRFTLADGRTLAYREYGDAEGRPVLAFHEGLGSSLMPAGSQALALRLGLRVVAVDRPGFGQSDPRPHYDFDGVAADMVALCDHLGLDRPALLGVMSGGASALQTAVRLGDRARLVLLASARTPGRRQSLTNVTNAHVLMRARLESNPWIVETLLAIVRLRRSHAATRHMVWRTAALAAGDRDYLETRPETVDYVWAYLGEALARSSRGPADEIKTFGQPQDLTGLVSPVAVWHGAQDVIAPLPDLIDHLGDHLSEMRVVEGIGYFMCLREWDAILTRLADDVPESFTKSAA